VRFLRKRLEGMVIVDLESASARRDPTRIYFGAWVQLEHLSGDTRWHRLVGPDEFDMASDYISMDSPLGRALLRKRLDEEVSWEAPGGARTLVIVAIEYDTPTGLEPVSS
jgi:transcription elongation factor GreB